jgi:EAL domain-containing protein (putative c-di-GMP-specific phosphodiesterase class I)
MKWMQAVKRHLGMTLRLPFPDRMLKLFPPTFTLRDPVLSLLDRTRRDGKRCALILLRLEGALPLQEAYPAEWITRLRQCVKTAIKGVLPGIVSDSDFIGVKHVHDDCVLFVSGDPLDYDGIDKLASALKSAVEHRVADLFDPVWGGHIRFKAGHSFVSPDIADTKSAVWSAFQHAMNAADGKLPSEFGKAHLQLFELIRDEDIRVVAQPIMNLETGEVSGWELLTRGPLNTPLHLPELLFEYAYQAELLAKLELLVFKKAFREMEKRGIRETVFLNLTAVSLARRSFFDALRKMLDEAPHVRPDGIVIEITERHRVDDYSVLAQLLREYRELGFRFAVDDAGTGYASLELICEMVPDMIKIDRSLIRDIDRITVKQVMLRSILYVAEHMNCQVIAEGVERQEEAHVLFRHRVDMGQGYYFARPAPFAGDGEPGYLQKLKEKIIAQRQASTA